MLLFTQVKQAMPEDTQMVMDLLVQTAEWLKGNGSTQWNGLLSGDDSHHTPEVIKRGELFTYLRGSELVGIVMLLQHPSAWDRELWGEEGHDNSVYLHRLAINREYAGKGLGRQMMQWAESGIPFPGKQTIRLDCIADNPSLNAFYSGLGYEHKGMASNPLGQFSKYEKRV